MFMYVLTSTYLRFLAQNLFICDINIYYIRMIRNFKRIYHLLNLLHTLFMT